VCYRKHGFPSGHKLQSVKTGSVNQMETQHEPKHNDQQRDGDQDFKLTQQQYQALLGLLQQTNDVSKASANINQVGSITSCSFDPGIVTLTAHSLNKDKCLKWILDFGATNHISSSLSNYVYYNQIHPIPVNLLDGTLLILSIM